MAVSGWRYLGAGFLAFGLGPLFGLIFGKPGLIYGTAVVAICLAALMGAREGLSLQAAVAGMLTMTAPGLAAGLPARWIAEALWYNHYLNEWEQVKVSAFVLVLLLVLGGFVGMTGGLLAGLTRQIRRGHL